MISNPEPGRPNEIACKAYFHRALLAFLEAIEDIDRDLPPDIVDRVPRWWQEMRYLNSEAEGTKIAMEKL